MVAARFHAACREHGVSLQVHPGIWQALRSHARWLPGDGNASARLAVVPPTERCDERSHEGSVWYQ